MELRKLVPPEFLGKDPSWAIIPKLSTIVRTMQSVPVKIREQALA